MQIHMVGGTLHPQGVHADGLPFVPHGDSGRLFQESLLKGELKLFGAEGFDARLLFDEHHLTHAASSPVPNHRRRKL